MHLFEAVLQAAAVLCKFNVPFLTVMCSPAASQPLGLVQLPGRWRTKLVVPFLASDALTRDVSGYDRKYVRSLCMTVHQSK